MARRHSSLLTLLLWFAAIGPCWAVQVTTRFDPDTQSIGVNDSAVVNFKLDCGGLHVNTITIVFQFDDTLLSFDGGTVDTGVWNGPSIINPFLCDPNIVVFSASMEIAEFQNGDNVQVCDLNFTGLGTGGNSPLTIESVCDIIYITDVYDEFGIAYTDEIFEDGEIILSAPTPTPTASSTPTPTPTASSTPTPTPSPGPTMSNEILGNAASPVFGRANSLLAANTQIADGAGLEIDLVTAFSWPGGEAAFMKARRSITLRIVQIEYAGSAGLPLVLRIGFSQVSIDPAFILRGTDPATTGLTIIKQHQRPVIIHPQGRYLELRADGGIVQPIVERIR